MRENNDGKIHKDNMELASNMINNKNSYEMKRSAMISLMVIIAILSMIFLAQCSMGEVDVSYSFIKNSPK